MLWALERLGDVAGLEPGTARAWPFVRTVDYWLMGLGHGLTVNPVRCERIVGALER